MQKALPPYRTLLPTAAGASSSVRSSSIVDTGNVGKMGQEILKSRINNSLINIGGKNILSKNEFVVDGTSASDRNVTKMVSENAVIAFGRRGCCMCHVVKQLLLGLGVNPTIFFVEEDEEAAVIDELSRIDGGGGGDELQFPAVFLGGKLFGGLERVMATHITGELVPMLREARALWL